MSARDTARPDAISGIDALLWELVQRYRRDVLDGYNRYGLPVSDVLLLEALAQSVDTPTVLARTLGWPGSRVTLVLNRLTGYNLAERTQNPHDARSVWVTLTPTGLELVETVKRKRQARLETILAGFSTKERERLQRYLVKLTDGMATLGGPTEAA